MLRRGRPILRTAAIVGTASVVSGSVQHHQQQKYAAQDAEAQQQAYAQQAAAAPPPAAGGESDLDELTKLAQLHQQGILTDEEFAAKKAQILGI
ncbi:MAG TPA: SHOCT domain-containing protein [Acidimicrobiia bacterium]|nr:SHOCT domain-containing protein [Acidimicrobiia bacterium]